jgi:hypothetical protein
LLLFVKVLAVSLDFAPLIGREFGGKILNGNVSRLNKGLLFQLIETVFAKSLTDI